MLRKKTNDLVVGLVTHKSCLVLLEQTLSCLVTAVNELAGSVLASQVKIVVVDNSDDYGYLESLRKILAMPKFDDVAIELLHTENRGFGSAHNQIINSNVADFYLVLNPDVKFESSALVCAISALVEQGADLVVPKVFDAAGNEQPLHIHAPSPIYILIRAFAPTWIRKLLAGYTKKIEDVSINSIIPRGSRILFSGCCMLFRRNSILSLNGFDEKYFLYFEDYDLSLRALSKGPAIISGEFSIIHYGGGASKKSWTHRTQFIKSSLRFYRKLYLTGFES
ncbi:glycosyltransferase [Microbulbifer sp. ALW1]|uniref:glycosyltransferase n=1 Tax=Microbulbifer sp. (strain ALW1) TaxID=1516059 RepID=UPI00135B7303|nr:glycosyltransferase family 2 protein [Microbulbifer sp. ALW1]